ncbi:MAG: hypothetical protein R2688_00315 [Fimbriimonadaceae bacterium]
MVMVVCTKTLKWPSRWIGGGVSLYILLLMQSRTTIAALVIALFIYWALGLGRNAGKMMLISLLGFGVASLHCLPRTSSCTC